MEKRAEYYSGTVRQTDEQYAEFIRRAFELAEMPEVEEDQLEEGCYTNAHITSLFREDPHGLVIAILALPKTEVEISKRRLLSMTCDIVVFQFPEKSH